MLTKQQIFTKVKEHLLAQGARASQNGACKYRTSEGYKCAVGCLIEDQYYDPIIEGVGIHDLQKGYKGCSKSSLLRTVLETSNVPTDPDTLSMLEHLQNVHDNSSVYDWENNLKEVARMFGVNYE